MNPRIGRMPPTRPSGITDGGRLRQIPRHLHDFYLMWIFTTQGFYSVVQHVDRPEQVIVRCRTREDLEALGEQIPSLEPFEDAGADYRYRAVVDRSDWVAALSALAEQLDYPNFKNEVANRQGYERSALYGHLWSALRPLQPRGGKSGPR